MPQVDAEDVKVGLSHDSFKRLVIDITVKPTRILFQDEEFVGVLDDSIIGNRRRVQVRHGVVPDWGVVHIVIADPP